MKHEYELKLASEDKRIVWGEVYIPNVPDTDGEFMDTESVEKMAYDFMRNLRLKMVDSFHNNQEVEGTVVIESFIARKNDPDFIEGAWVVGVHVPDDEMWSRIKKGEINGFSMEALVTKTPVELEFDIPPVLIGRTQMSKKAEGDEEDHDHEFYVSYNEEGNFLGGHTSNNAGHYHTIKRGTVTEMTGSHRHRFAHVDVMRSPLQGVAAVVKVDISGIDLEVAGKKNPEGSGSKPKPKKKRNGGLAQYIYT